MITLSELVLEQEQENTQLILHDEMLKAVEEDPLFVELVQLGLEKLAACVKYTPKKCIPYVRFDKASNIFCEVIYSYRHILNSQIDLDKLIEGAKEDGAILDEWI